MKASLKSVAKLVLMWKAVISKEKTNESETKFSITDIKCFCEKLLCKLYEKTAALLYFCLCPVQRQTQIQIQKEILFSSPSLLHRAPSSCRCRLHHKEGYERQAEENNKPVLKIKYLKGNLWNWQMFNKLHLKFFSSFNRTIHVPLLKNDSKY